MRLIRFGPPGRERAGILTPDGTRRDCSAHFEDWNADFLGTDGLRRLEVLLEEEADALPSIPSEARWGACVARPGKVLAIGLNYRDHAAESGLEPPAEPVVFMKATSAVVGPNDPILIPRGSLKTDWEVELGVVIGHTARYLSSPDDSAAHIAGYCVGHDVSERSYQLERCGQWDKGKSCDTFCPLGPQLVTPDEAGDVGNLRLSLDVNGVRKQDGTTRNMIFDVPFLVHYLSHFMTLEPGDVILTGTPPGVGMGRTPQQFLRAGDVVELRAEGLGEMRQVCMDA